MTSHRDKLIITIDGPSGSGKSTTAKKVAERLGYSYLDTGAMYRAMTLKVLRTGTDPTDALAVSALLAGTVIDVLHENRKQQTWLDGKDVSGDIRNPDVTSHVSEVSAIRDVRAFLVRRQQDIARGGGFVVDGRDAGTAIFPDADLKFFMTASGEERARRRMKQLLRQNDAVTFEETLKDLIARDDFDSSREESPLIKAKDAIAFDNSDMALEEQVDFILDQIADRFGREFIP